jgi:hypothetical protein
LGRLGVHGVYAYIEAVAQIAKVLLQRSLGGFICLKAIRFPRRLAHGPPAFEAVAMVRHDLKHVDDRHTVSLCSAACSFSRSEREKLQARYVFPLSSGSGLKGALDNFLPRRVVTEPQESAEHGDVCRHVYGLRIHLHLDPKSDPPAGPGCGQLTTPPAGPVC